MTTGYTCSTICNTGLLLHRTTGYTGLLVTQNYWLHISNGYTGLLVAQNYWLHKITGSMGSKNRSLDRPHDYYKTTRTQNHWLHMTTGYTGLLVTQDYYYKELQVTHDYWLQSTIGNSRPWVRPRDRFLDPTPPPINFVHDYFFIFQQISIHI